ncbi:AMIN domain-containing protein [Desulfovibrio inopinatus]|uniref:AMIN domain-containing protein n=1 Tax=Desulfovibrio inopinatus TaxID=102109 RepID=UPI0003F793CB|nr:AMIN domain-containing protein [Desulfovibrio inopinatus]
MIQRIVFGILVVVICILGALLYRQVQILPISEDHMTRENLAGLVASYMPAQQQDASSEAFGTPASPGSTPMTATPTSDMSSSQSGISAFESTHETNKAGGSPSQMPSQSQTQTQTPSSSMTPTPTSPDQSSVTATPTPPSSVAEEGMANAGYIVRRDVVSPRTRINRIVENLEWEALKDVNSLPADRVWRPKRPDATAKPTATPTRTAAATPTPFVPKSTPTKPTPTTPTVSGKNAIRTIRVEVTKDGAVLQGTTAMPIDRVTMFTVSAPPRLVLDLHGVFANYKQTVNVPQNSIFKNVRTGLHKTKMRIVADLVSDKAAVVPLTRQTRANEFAVTMQLRE